MKKRKLIGFFFAIALGLAAGLFYGWMVNPAKAANATLNSMRADYQADFVLMVAEAYPQPDDLPEAIKMLQQLDAKDPIAAVQKGLLTAQELGYSARDIKCIVDLEMRLSESTGEP